MSDEDCGCCEGVGAVTPDPLDNAPGLPALSYRVGTHATFLRTMMARLSTLQAETGTYGTEGKAGEASCLGESHRTFLLGGDPEAATALLDGWACIADVLTFYQERIANEGYLRTATEERSVIELGRLTGYEPRPGVAASVYLAFSVQDGFDGEIPEGTRTQSMPRPGQTPAMFETSAPITARAEWNEMRARRRASGRYIRREYIESEDDLGEPRLVPTRRIEIFLDGTGQNVQPGDVVLLEQSDTVQPQHVYRVTNAWPSEDQEHTTLRLVPIDGDWIRKGEWDTEPEEGNLDPTAVPTLRTAPSSIARARRTLQDLLGSLGWRDGQRGDDPDPETILALVAPGMPELRGHIQALIRTLQPEPAPKAHVMRVRTQVFGHNASPRIETTTTTSSSTSEGKTTTTTTSTTDPTELRASKDEASNVVYLDGEHAAIRAGTWLVMRALPLDYTTTSPLETMVFDVTNAEVRSRREYGISGKTTWVSLSGSWWSPRIVEHSEEEDADITPIRRAVVYAQAEPLTLVGEWLEEDVGGASIDLDRVVEELPGDRWLLVEGERSDLPRTRGVRAAELVRVSSTRPVFTTPPPKRKVNKGEKAEWGNRARPYTEITLTTPLRYRYRRTSLVVRGNVAHATHGETRDEILGSGDATIPEQRFTLRQGPRTWVSAPTPTGIASTLQVRVGGILWPETPWYEIPGPRDEVVRTRTLADRKDEIRGGDGRRGARFPTGVENLKAKYRVGIGAAGNVDAGLITALVTRPLGVREVTNPLRSSGGADPDGRDEIRTRIPIAARGIDRLVSVADHADFALNFAGIDKAAARHVPGAGATIEVVIAGDELVAIDEGSDLLRNLRAAFQRYGDPMLRPVVRVARGTPLVLQARVRIDPRHEWATVEAAMRARLLARHGWDARGIGEPVHLSVILEILQAVPGVQSIDVDVFGPLRRVTRPPRPAPHVPRSPFEELIDERIAGLVERIADAEKGRPWRYPADPDEILYFASNAPATITFSEIAP